MKTTPLLACLSVLMAAVPTLAQSAAIAPAAARPSAANASAGGQAINQMLPAGPLAGNGGLQASASAGGESANANVAWQTEVLDGFARFEMIQDLQSVGGATTGAAVDFEVVLQITNSVPIQVRMALAHSLQATVGTPVPLLRVDVGDDGIVDLYENSSSELNLSIAIGPQPLAVRITMATSVAGVFSNAYHRCAVGLWPQAQVQVSEVMLPCDIWGLSVSPTFLGDIALDASSGGWIAQPTIVVLGFGAQVVAIPPALSVSPLCLLLPTPDSVQFQTSSAPLRLSIPAALRPLTLFAQAVMLTPAGIATTNGHRVHAY